MKLFCQKFDGSLFDSLEDDVCAVAPVAELSLECQEHVPTQASTAHVAAGSFPFAISPDLQCSVCLEPLSERSAIISLMCLHQYHLKCLTKCIDSSCPICRYPIGRSPTVNSFSERCLTQRTVQFQS